LISGTIKIKSDVKETQTDLIEWNNYLSQINSLNKKSKKQESPPASSQIDEVIYLGNKRPVDESNTDASGHDSLTCKSNIKKSRILIGKNVKKIPELSCSTLERQLGIIISDASNYLKEQEEKEKQQNLELNANNNHGNNNCNSDVNCSKFTETYFATPTRLTDLSVQPINQGQSIIVDCSKFNSPSKIMTQHIGTQIPILNGIPILYNNTSTKVLTTAAANTVIPIESLNQILQSQDIMNGKIKIDRMIRPQVINPSPS